MCLYVYVERQIKETLKRKIKFHSVYSCFNYRSCPFVSSQVAEFTFIFESLFADLMLFSWHFIFFQFYCLEIYLLLDFDFKNECVEHFKWNFIIYRCLKHFILL